MTTIKTPEQADRQFAAISRERSEAKDKAAKLKAKFVDIGRRDRPELETERRQIAAEMEVVETWLRNGYSEFKAAQLRATETAGESIMGNAGYRRLVQDAAAAICSQLEPIAALGEAQQEALRVRVNLAPLIAPAIPIEMAVTWLRACARRGLLDVAKLTPALRRRVEE